MPINAGDAGTVAAIGGVVGIIGKTLFDFYSKKRDSEAGDKKLEQDGENKLQETLLSSLSASNNTAQSWMGKYADVLDKFAIVQGDVASLKAKVGTLESKVAELETEKRAAIDEAKELRAENNILRETISIRDGQIVTLAQECEDIRRGFEGALTLVEGMADSRVDSALTNAAAASVKNVIDHLQRVDIARSNKEKAATKETP